MTPNLRDKINWINSIYKDYIKNGKKNYHYIQLQNAMSDISVATSRGRDEEHSRLVQKLSYSCSVGTVLRTGITYKKIPL